MKRLLISLSLALATMLQVSAQQQNLDLSQAIPNDPEVRVGMLDNGIKYYLRKNTKDPQRANFHIFYNVGAAQENDRQNGLAHFLEHMAFNGSKNFPGNNLVEYCQSIGVAFGKNLNAGTDKEYTSYRITDVPITREGIIDSMLLALHDWAGFITLDEKDIDEERKVIIEEWRMYRGMPQRRLTDTIISTLVGDDNILNKRNVIGTVAGLETFSYQDIRDFYNKWYRPDLQAFIIVGDFDLDMMEAKLKATMADIKAHDVKAPKEKIKVTPNEEPRFAILTDPELSSTSVDINIRLDPMPIKYNNTVMAAKANMLDEAINMMLSERLDNISKEANSPFLSAYVYVTDYMSPFNWFALGAEAREGEALKAFNATYTELLRAARGGFAEPELERAKAKLSANIENQYANRNDRHNDAFAQAMQDNFYRNKPYPAADTEYQINKALIEATTLEEVNSRIAEIVTDQNNVVYVTAQNKAGVAIPTEADLAATMAAVKASEIAPYTEDVVTRPLIDASKLKGSAVAKTETGKYETTVWTLKNGVKIVVKPTTYKADEILFSANRKGGTSTIGDIKDLYSINLWSAFEGNAGLSDFSQKELMRALAGKNAGVSPFVDDMMVGYQGQSTIKDLETMLQLTYLYATAPRFNEEDWKVTIDQLMSQVKGSVKDPMRIFRDSLANTLYGGNPRKMNLNEQMLSEVSLERLAKCYKEFFSTTTDMTFFFTGSIDLNALKPLVEKYIGSIPAPKSKTPAKIGKYIDDFVPGEVTNRFTVPQEAKRALFFRMYNGSINYNGVEKANLDILGDVLQILYTKTIREEAGGVYSVSNMIVAMKNPKPMFIDQVFFMCDPDRMDELVPLVKQGVDQMVSEGPSVENLNKAKENAIKEFKDNNNTNRYWAEYVKSWYTWGLDPYTDCQKNIEGVTIETVREAAKRAFDQNKSISIIMLP